MNINYQFLRSLHTHKNLTISFLCVFFAHFTLLSQPQEGFHFLGKNTRTSVIPFELVNNLMIISVSINDSDTLRLILDTGVNATVITNLGQYDSLSLASVRHIELSGLGNGDPIKALQSSGNTIRLKDVQSRTEIVYVLEQDIFFLSQLMGMNVHGLIGFSIFSTFVVDIDYPNKRLTLYEPSFFEKRYGKRDGEHLPIIIERGKPYIEGVAVEYDGKPHRVKMLIDTGASHSLSFYAKGEDQIRIPVRSFRAFLGKGLNGEIYGEIGRIKRFALGKLQLPDPVANFPDSADVELVLGQSDRNGSIGAELLRHFRIIFNYPKGEIILKKGAFFKSPFEYNMSGVEIVTPIPGVPYYVVSNVRDGSPASLAGVKPGDEIIQLNGAAGNRYSLNEMTSIFRGKPKKKIKLLVKRNSVILRYEFVLQHII